MRNKNSPTTLWPKPEAVKYAASGRQGTGSRGQVTRIKEQGARNREQGTGNRGQGASGKTQPTPSVIPNLVRNPILQYGNDPGRRSGMTILGNKDSPCYNPVYCLLTCTYFLLLTPCFFHLLLTSCCLLLL
ncbi:MAG: hypothetical protein BRC37_03160 [Cyanobacteria bacterium QH_3_48_40]|nr:MAG: hypothetical protein BRC37_03160 [Cyanobacteria bacterium QH_3_48_40]